jgi:hypothetical protein
MRKEYRQRLAEECRYAATKMQQETQIIKKLFYFSVFFAEPQRLLNLEWDRDLVLVHQVVLQTHTQIVGWIQQPATTALGIDWVSVLGKLTEAASDLASYFEKSESTDHKQICEILGRMAEIAYIAGGNGSYLFDRGIIKL